MKKEKMALKNKIFVIVLLICFPRFPFFLGTKRQKKKKKKLKEII
jgi:preprotein translocase subunit YajC